MHLEVDMSDTKARRIAIDGEWREVGGDPLTDLAEWLKEQEYSLSSHDTFSLVQQGGSFTGLRIGASIVNAFRFAVHASTLPELTVPKYDKEPNITFSTKHA